MKKMQENPEKMQVVISEQAVGAPKSAKETEVDQNSKHTEITEGQEAKQEREAKEEKEVKKAEEDKEDDPEQKIEAEAPAAENPETEDGGGQALVVTHLANEGDIFGDEYDLGLDDDDEDFVLLVHLDDEEINRFFLEQIADDPIFNAPQVQPNLANPDSYMSYGNTQLNVNNGFNLQFQNFNLFNGFALFSFVSAAADLSGPSLAVNGSVLDNDDGLRMTVIGVKDVSEGAIVEMNEDGTFRYVPPPGWTNRTDTFTYLMQDAAGKIYEGVVEIQVGARIWYVDNSSVEQPPIEREGEIVQPELTDKTTSGTGTSVDPFTSLIVFMGDNRPDAPGDIIFIHTGINPYEAGIQLLPGQQLIGEGVDLIIDDNILWFAGWAPVLTNTQVSIADGAGVVLADGNILSGFSLMDTAGYGIVGYNIDQGAFSFISLMNLGHTGLYLEDPNQTFVLHDIYFDINIASAIEFSIDQNEFNLFLMDNYFNTQSEDPLINGSAQMNSLIYLLALNNYFNADDSDVPALILEDDGSSTLNLVMQGNTADTSPIDYDFDGFLLVQIDPINSTSIDIADVISDLNQNTQSSEVGVNANSVNVLPILAQFSALDSLDAELVQNELNAII